MKIALLGYTGDRGNWGCQSTSRKLLRLVREAFAHRSPEVRTVAFPRTHPLDRLHAAAHGGRIEAILRDPAPSVPDLRFLESLALERHGRFAEIPRSADLVLFQAEGNLGPSRLLRNAQLLLLPVVARSLWGKPVVSLNQTLHATGESDRSLLAAVFRRFDLNAVRESMSLALAREIGLSDAMLCPDLALAPDEPGAAAAVPRLAPGYFCVTGSASLEHYDLAAFAGSVRAVARSTGLRPVFVHSRRRDDALRAAFFPEAEVLGSDALPGYPDLVSVLKDAAFTLGGRYHTAIAGLVHGIPALLLPGNNPKGEGLGRMVPVGVSIFLPDQAEAMAAKASAVLAGGEGLRARILAEVVLIQDRQRRFGQLLSARFAPAAAPVSAPEPSEFMPETSPPLIDSAAARLYELTNLSASGLGPRRARAELELRRLLPGFADSVERSFTDLP